MLKRNFVREKRGFSLSRPCDSPHCSSRTLSKDSRQRRARDVTGGNENEKLRTYLGRFENLVGRDRLCDIVDLVSDVLRSRSAIRHVVLDSEIVVGATRVMARSEQDTAGRLVLANDIRGSGGREDTILANEEFRDAVGGGDAQDDVHGRNGKVSTVSADNERRALGSSRDGIEDSLHKVLGVVFLLEDFDAVRDFDARFLVGEDVETIVSLFSIDLDELRASTNRLRRPEVPGFWPSKGLVGISLISADMVDDEG